MFGVVGQRVAEHGADRATSWLMQTGVLGALTTPFAYVDLLFRTQIGLWRRAIPLL